MVICYFHLLKLGCNFSFPSLFRCSFISILSPRSSSFFIKIYTFAWNSCVFHSLFLYQNILSSFSTFIRGTFSLLFIPRFVSEPPPLSFQSFRWIFHLISQVSRNFMHMFPIVRSKLLVFRSMHFFPISLSFYLFADACSDRRKK